MMHREVADERRTKTEKTALQRRIDRARITPKDVVLMMFWRRLSLVGVS
jgi:hypothetical protein